MIFQRSILLAILILTGVLIAAAQGPTFRIAAEEVRIDVLVTDNGKPIGDLKATDFEIFDNGVKQIVKFKQIRSQLSVYR